MDTKKNNDSRESDSSFKQEDEKENAVKPTHIDYRLLETDHRSNPIKSAVEIDNTSVNSSQSSIKKLEWDNGADIGYNCQKINEKNTLFKSSSLPILSELKHRKVDFYLPNLYTSSKSTSSSSSSHNDIKIVIENFSDSSQSKWLTKESKDASSSSSLVENTDKYASVTEVESISLSNTDNSEDKPIENISSDSSGRKLLEFVSTLSYLKQKIGLPDAHSTPNFVKAVEFKEQHTFKITSQENTNNSECEKKSSNKTNKDVLSTSNQYLYSTSSSCKSPFKNKMLLKESKTHDNESILLTKSIFENPCQRNGPTSPSIEQGKVQQNRTTIVLSLTKPIIVECVYSPSKHAYELAPKSPVSTVAVQTECCNDKINTCIFSQTNQQNHKNQSVISLKHGIGNYECTTQTDYDLIASNCDSFEYVAPQVYNTKSEANVPQISLNNQKCILKRSVRQDDLRISSLPQNGNKKNILYNGLISKNTDSSSNLSIIAEDVVKNINLIQKLLRSKKYPSRTKKRYIKKLIQKITDSQYLEDSTTSSELFFPRKETVVEKANTQAKAFHQPISTESTKSSETNKKNGILQSNLPWYPIQSQSNNYSKKKLQIRTFMQEILPHQSNSSQGSSSQAEIIPVESSNTNSSFTFTNNELSDFHGAKHSDKQFKKFSENTSLKRNYESTSSTKLIYENWREDTTFSEQIFDGKSLDNNYLIKLAENEKAYQITWITNEISHLCKLKHLLESEKIKHITKNKKKIPENQNRENTDIKKHITVYKIRQKNGDSDSSERNYIIETQLGSKSSNNINFCMDGKSYCVTENEKFGQFKGRPVVGDIKVQSNGGVTNIKVSTSCEICMGLPCVCTEPATEMSKTSDTPCISHRKTVCQICDQDICICSEKNDTSSIEPDIKINDTELRAVCYVCHKMPCCCNLIKWQQSGDLYLSNNTNNLDSTGALPKELNKADFRDRKTLENAAGPENRGNVATNNLNSLKKVFENCSCKTKDTRCSCSFVKKLLDHFHIKKSEIRRDNKISQTAQLKLDYQAQHKGVNTQTSKSGKCLIGSQSQASGVYHDIVKKEINDLPLSCVYMQNDPSLTNSLMENITSQTSDSMVPKFQNKPQVIGVSQTSRHKSPETISHDKKKSICTEMHKKKSICTEMHAKFLYSGLPTKNRCPDTEGIISQDNLVSEGVQADSEFTNKNFKHSCSSLLLCTCQVQTDHNLKPADVQTNEFLKNITTPTSNQNVLLDKIDLKKKSFQARVNTRHKTSQTLSKSLIAKTAQTENYKHSISNDQNSKLESNVTENKNCEGSESKFVYSEMAKKENGKIVVPCCECLHEQTNFNAENSTYATFSGPGSTSASVLTSVLDIVSASSKSHVKCACCKKNTSNNDGNYIQHENDLYPLCYCCYTNRPMLTSISYSASQHVCKCSDLVQNNMGEYCTCTKPMLRQSKHYCKYCQCKLTKTCKTHNGIAYILTLEESTLHKDKRNNKKQSLEEIKVTVPKFYSRKKLKDKENYFKKDEKTKEGYIFNKVNNINGESNNTSEDSIVKFHEKQHTLQEYLMLNRPEFINSADYRRQMVMSSKISREKDKDVLKLNFLDANMKNIANKKTFTLFSEREIKEITKKNYKKLPEVQQKVYDQKEGRLRTADKLISNVFSKKIQKSVLKGKRNFPIYTNLVNVSR